MRKKTPLSAAIVTLGLCTSLLFQTPIWAEEAQSASSISTNAIPGWPQGPDITSQAAVILEESTGVILYSKNADEALFPGSAVKVMTCLLALENASLSDEVTMTSTGVSGVTDGGANISAQLEEVFTMEQCLYAVMVASANDIALQVAEHVGGSVEAFVDLMNGRAKELGCTDTVFTNPTGLPDENQHTTAHDMALIMKAAMDNEDFIPIAQATSYNIPATNVSGGGRALTSKFTMINPSSDGYYEGCLGGKEGYTQASGSTLVCGAERNGMRLICAVLKGAPGQTDDEAITLLDYGFSNFRTDVLGEDDFSFISGGQVVLPAQAGVDSLTVSDATQGDEISRTYSFGQVPVGYALLEQPAKQDRSAAIAGEANMAAAKAYSDSHSQAPYYVIAGVGFLIVLLLFIRMVKIIRS